MEDKLQDMIIEMAHHLGETIKGDRRFDRYSSAQEAFAKCGELNRLITEYNAQQAALSSVYASEDKDKTLIESIEGRVNTLYMEITENEVYREYTDASSELDALLKAVNDEIQFVLTGEYPHSCTGDCSACGGCGHDHNHGDEHIYD